MRISRTQHEEVAWRLRDSSYPYSPCPRFSEALSEIKRVLRPGGLLLLAFHIGDNVLHLDEWWGQKVSVDFFFFRPEEMRGYLKSAGFTVEETIER